MDISISLFLLELDPVQMTMTSKSYLIAYVNAFLFALGNLM